jgi:hypothetical protein
MLIKLMNGLRTEQTTKISDMRKLPPPEYKNNQFYAAVFCVKSVAQPIKKFPSFMEHEVYYRVHIDLPLEPIQSIVSHPITSTF